MLQMDLQTPTSSTPIFSRVSNKSLVTHTYTLDGGMRIGMRWDVDVEGVLLGIVRVQPRIVTDSLWGSWAQWWTLLGQLGIGVVVAPDRNLGGFNGEGLYLESPTVLNIRSCIFLQLTISVNTSRIDTHTHPCFLVHCFPITAWESMPSLLCKPYAVPTLSKWVSRCSSHRLSTYRFLVPELSFDMLLDTQGFGPGIWGWCLLLVANYQVRSTFWFLENYEFLGKFHFLEISSFLKTLIRMRL